MKPVTMWAVVSRWDNIILFPYHHVEHAEQLAELIKKDKHLEYLRPIVQKCKLVPDNE